MKRNLLSTLVLILGVGGCDSGDDTGIHAIPLYGATYTEFDADGDGFGEYEDCDDYDFTVNPDADELCDDSIDNDCDELTDEEDPDCQE